MLLPAKLQQTEQVQDKTRVAIQQNGQCKVCHVVKSVTSPNVAHGLLELLCALEGGQVGHLHDRLADNLGSLRFETIASKAARATR